MQKIIPFVLFVATYIVSTVSASGDDTRVFVTGGVTVSHSARNEGLYYDTPARRVAYNVQVMKLAPNPRPRYVTIFHSEARNHGFRKPGDSIRLGYVDGAFTYTMPGNCEYRLWGVQDDQESLLFSPDVFGLPGWGGTGNPMMIKGAAGDDYYYIFFLCVADDNHDKDVQVDDWRHDLLEARTKDFINIEIRTEIDGKTCWRRFADDVPQKWRRPKPLLDVRGEPVRAKICRNKGRTQGLIGSMCKYENTYYFFYTEIDADNKTYLFYRTSPNIATIENTWSPAMKISGEALMEGTCIRVARAVTMNRWVVLYNGYTDLQKKHVLHQELMLQVTDNMTVIGKGGLSSLKILDRYFHGLGISDRYYLGLSRGNGVYGQHDFMTDEYGNLASPTPDNATTQRSFITTTAFTPMVYGSKVYWAEFDLKEGATSDSHATKYRDR